MLVEDVFELDDVLVADVVAVVFAEELVDVCEAEVEDVVEAASLSSAAAPARRKTESCALATLWKSCIVTIWTSLLASTKVFDCIYTVEEEKI